MIKFKAKGGHIAYKCTYDEIVRIYGGVYAYRCDFCSKISNTFYIVPVLNGGYCDKCFERWDNERVFEVEDLPFQKTFIKYIEELAKSIGIKIEKEQVKNGNNQNKHKRH